MADKPIEDAFELLRSWRNSAGWVGKGPSDTSKQVFSGAESYAEQGEYRLRCAKCGKLFLYTGFKPHSPRWHRVSRGPKPKDWTFCGELSVFETLRNLTRPKPESSEEGDDD